MAPWTSPNVLFKGGEGRWRAAVGYAVGRERLNWIVCVCAVSYTHLDVYKRQVCVCVCVCVCMRVRVCLRFIIFLSIMFCL